MTPTILTNLALSKIGHTLVKALGDTTSKDSRLAALHYEPCLREALRAHFWSFAMTTRPLEAVDVREYLTITGPLKLGSTSLTIPRLFKTEALSNGKMAFAEDEVEDSLLPPSTVTWTGSEWRLVHGPSTARWARGINNASPELRPLRPVSPTHFLETNLSGDNNDLRFEQIDQAAAPAAVEIREPAASAITLATAEGRVVTITPATKARMIISGAVTPGVNGMLYYAGDEGNGHHWTSNGRPYFENFGGLVPFVALTHHGDDWECVRHVGPSSTPDYHCQVTSAARFPDGLTFNAPYPGTGTCVVSAVPSSALQVLQAVHHPFPTAIRISGTLTNGTNPVVIPELKFAGFHNTRPFYTDTGAVADAGWAAMWQDAKWVIFRLPYGDGGIWTGEEDVATPDLVAGWQPVPVNTGVPVVTAAGGPLPSTLVTAMLKVGNDGSGAVTAMPRTSLGGGVAGEPVMRRITPAAELLGWSHAYQLPADFIKAKALLTPDGRRVDKFAIRRVAGKTCILCNHDAVSLEYVQYLDDPASFDPLFVKAFTTLFAAKLARAISGSDDMEARFLQIFETVDLPAARTASGHETDSSENHPLRELLDGTLTPGRGDFFPRN